MSDNSQGATHSPVRSETNLRSLVIVGYILFLLAMANGLTAVAGVLLAYIKRDDARGTVWFSHFENMIVVFWVMLLGAFAALALHLLLFPISLGLLLSGQFVWPAVSLLSLPVLLTLAIWPILFVWFLYRMIRGLVRASDNRAY
jgi:uncharacterized membrane protein